MNFLKVFLFGSLCVLATACSNDKKEEDVVETANVPLEVVGPNIQGVWYSQCIANSSQDGGFERVKLDIEDKSMKYVRNSYKDELCFEETKNEVFEGVYTYTLELKDKVFVTEFKVPVENSVLTLEDFNLQKTEEVLKISRFYNATLDDPDQILLEIELTTKVPEPAPKPVPVLESGFFEQISGSDDFCRHIVSTMKSDGKTAVIYVDFYSPCSGKVELICDEKLCDSDVYSLELISDSTYMFTNKTNNKNGLFEKVR
jgi:hypothetical protein